MQYQSTVDVLKNIVSKLNLPESNLLSYLNNHQDPVIYLCGKSSTGKTTFLNALLNRDRDELPVSTNISTQTEFRFIYGTENTYYSVGSNFKDIPSGLIERKELFKTLNKEGSGYFIKLFEHALSGRTVVDIPGILDFKGNTKFSDNLLIEADVVYFFTPCLGKISVQEHEVLSEISLAEIPIVVLFTMADITEPDEGITRQTIPNYVSRRLETCFIDIEVEHYQIISSNDFYKNKDNHGIDKLQSYIETNETHLQNKAEIGRIRRCFRHYISKITAEITILEQDNASMELLIRRQNELYFESELRNVNTQSEQKLLEISDEVDWLKNTIQKKIYNRVLLKNGRSVESQREDFIDTWNQFWQGLQTDNPEISFSISPLPPIDDDIFIPVSFNIEKLREIEEHFMKSKDKSENVSYYTSSLIEFGFNLRNLQLIYNKWQMYQQLDIQIDVTKVAIEHQLTEDFKCRQSALLVAKNNMLQKALEENQVCKKLDSFAKGLNELQEAINGI